MIFSIFRDNNIFNPKQPPIPPFQLEFLQTENQAYLDVLAENTTLRKIVKEYEDQLQHLHKVLDAVKKENIAFKERMKEVEEQKSTLEHEVQKLKEQIKELQEQKAKNSTNSSKPSSTDNIKVKRKNLRGKTGRKVGGQPGHKGATLEMSDTPDFVIDLKAKACTCGCDLSAVPVDKIEKRQQYDLPEDIQLEVTEIRGEVKTCPNCGEQVRAPFPENMNAPVQYGPRIQAFAGYLINDQLLPFKRSAELINHLCNAGISPGTLDTFQKKLAANLENMNNANAEELRDVPVINCDETSFRINSERWWLHVVCTDTVTYYFVHPKRGSEAIDEGGILPDYKGTAVHDHYFSYLTYDCTHAECCAHILRELIFLYEERENNQWADAMIKLLLVAKEEVEQAVEAGKFQLDDRILETLHSAYDKIINDASIIHPQPQATPGKKGKPKGTKESNMLGRLINFKDDILRFIHDFQVPFDNNQAERDIRMTKIKQKISGCFRTIKGAKDWVRIRGCISTAKKHNQNVLDMLQDALKPTSS